HTLEQECSSPPCLPGADAGDALDRDGQEQRSYREHEPCLPEPEMQTDLAHQCRVLHGGCEPAEDRASDQVGPSRATVELVQLRLRPYGERREPRDPPRKAGYQSPRPGDDQG